MKHPSLIAAVAVLATTLLVPLAAEAAAPPAPSVAVAPAPIRRSRASLGLQLDHGTSWVGQPIAVTVTAVFRNVEGVTLEGAPTFSSKAVLTSEIAKEPRQSTEIVGGERVLVARWSAKVTPSAPGPLDLAVAMPVRLRWREAAARVEAPALPADPFDDDDVFGAGLFRGMRQRMQETLEASAGRVREEASELRATAATIDVRALPTEGRPASFSGAVGAFTIDDAIATDTGTVSDPLTLRITVGGAVDPDRVDVAGVASSPDWKAYPPRAVAADADAGVTARGAKKIFEQVLVPLHGGALTVPPVSFTAFDPATGTYVTRSTRPLAIEVAGAAAAAVPASAAPPPVVTPAPAQAMPNVTSRDLGIAGISALALALASALSFALSRLVRRRRAAWTLRRSMREAARAGDVEPFLGSAHRLIEERLSERWKIAPGDVTARRIEARLGEAGRPLFEILDADAALRFGHRELEGAPLDVLCRSVERSLRKAA